MRTYDLIGKTKHMTPVFINKGGVWRQFNIRLGITLSITEDEMTFHVERQVAKKVLDIVETTVVIPEKGEKEKPVLEEVVKAPPKKKRAYRKRVKVEEEVPSTDEPDTEL